MLNPDEQTRITCEEILQNDWCKQDIEEILNEMRRPSLSPDVPPPVVSSRRRSTRTPNPPKLPEVPTMGKQVTLNSAHQDYDQLYYKKHHVLRSFLIIDGDGSGDTTEQV